MTSRTSILAFQVSFQQNSFDESFINIYYKLLLRLEETYNRKIIIDTGRMALVEGETRLQDTWTLWYRQKSSKENPENYEDSLKPVASFDTVEGFWKIYNHLRRPADVSVGTDYSVFKQGVKPSWEDEQNHHGILHELFPFILDNLSDLISKGESGL
ncbi:MAG: eukaryotic translation initiation factor 4E [Bacteroidota bacterium]